VTADKLALLAAQMGLTVEECRLEIVLSAPIGKRFKGLHAHSVSSRWRSDPGTSRADALRYTQRWLPLEECPAGCSCRQPAAVAEE
jgi:hypothetical protein